MNLRKIRVQLPSRGSSIIFSSTSYSIFDTFDEIESVIFLFLLIRLLYCVGRSFPLAASIFSSNKAAAYILSNLTIAAIDTNFMIIVIRLFKDERYTITQTSMTHAITH